MINHCSLTPMKVISYSFNDVHIAGTLIKLTGALVKDHGLLS